MTIVHFQGCDYILVLRIYLYEVRSSYYYFRIKYKGASPGLPAIAGLCRGYMEDRNTKRTLNAKGFRVELVVDFHRLWWGRGCRSIERMLEEFGYMCSVL